MPKAIRLTQELISKLDAPGVYWDDLISGFAVSVYKSGTKSFLLKYRERGRQRWETIGKVGIVNCEQAREMAARLLAKVKVLKPTARVNMTVKEFCRYYLARYAEPRKKTWKLDEGRCRLYIEPRLGHLRLDQVTRADIARLHEDIGREKPVESNRVREQISKMWKLAKIWEILPDDFPNITLGIEDFKEQERTRYFTSAEIERLAASIDQERDVHVRSAFWLLLLTGLRRNEVLNMMWDDIDFEIPALKLKGKNGQVTWQHLSTPALMVLKHCPRKENNPYVVCGTSPGKSRNNIQKAWKRISDHAGLKDARIHDLRRTVGSWLVQSGVELATIQKVLNHKTISSTMIYSRISPADKARALEGHGKRLQRFIERSVGAPESEAELPIIRRPATTIPDAMPSSVSLVVAINEVTL